MTEKALTAETMTPTAIADLFDTVGIEEIVAGNTPFLLNDPQSVWLVRSGRVEVFAVKVQDGQPVGPRYHFLTADPDHALFGMDLERYGQGLGLLAVGVVGTKLRRLDLATVRRIATTSPVTPGFASVLDRWITGVSGGVARGIVPQPRADAQLGPRERVELRVGQRVRAKREVVWVGHTAGASLFLGMEEVAGAAPGGFPLASTAFLQALEQLRLTAEDTASVVATGSWWDGLQQFHAVVLACELFNAPLAAADELNRLKEKTERDQRIRRNALRDLASVVEGDSTVLTDADDHDPDFAACVAVGNYLHIKIQAPPKAPPDQPREEPLHDICRASRIRFRKVVLKDEWWTKDSTPVVAYREPGHHAVAILPSGPGRFDLYDPASGSRTRVNAQVAEGLEGVAYTLYRPFPAKPLRPLDLLKFGALHTRPDLMRPVIVGCGGGLLGMVPPYFMGLLVDSVIPEAARNQLVGLAVILATIGITTTFFEVVRSLSVLRVEAHMSASVQPAMWDRLLGLPVAFFRDFAAGDLAQRVGAVDAMRRLISGATASSIMTSVFSTFLFAQLFYYSWQLALVATAVIAVAMAVSMFTSYLKLQVYRQIMELEGKIAGLVLQLVTGIAKLRVAGAEGRAFAEWAREFARQKRSAVKTGAIENVLTVFNTAFPVLASIALFYSLMYLMEEAAKTGDTRISLGDFIAFNAAFGALTAQMLQLGMAVMSVLLVVPLYEQAKPVLEGIPEVDGTKSEPGELSGRIDVEHVSFRYRPDGPAILTDVTIRIAPGEFVAIVGPSGSGKSTLLRMFLGLEVPESGSIYYDGRDLAMLDVQKLRRRIGVVTQVGKVRAGSLFENIVGSAPLTEKDAMEAVRLAGFEEDVASMPMGLHTVVQQGGPTLSGGQRQRLMIARAIVNRPRILLFDEATSALDNRTQAIVTESLQQLQATRVVIAHRLSTIVGADRIYVLAAGTLVESGNHAELMARDGVFADLMRRQVV